MLLKLVLAIFAAVPAVPLHAAEFNSVAECSVGARVHTRQGQNGRITRVDRDWSYCYVTLDDTGKEVGFLYSFLEPAGSSPAPGAEAPRFLGPPVSAGGAGQTQGGGAGLAVGVYTCWVGTEASAMGLAITGPSSYVSDNQRGTFRVQASGMIVWDSGPFAGFNSKLLGNGRIGFNLSGGTFYNLTCDPPN